MASLKPMASLDEFVKSMEFVWSVTGRAEGPLYDHTFGVSVFFPFYDQYAVIVPALWRCFGIALAVSMAVAVTMLYDIWCVHVCICTCVQYFFWTV